MSRNCVAVLTARQPGCVLRLLADHFSLPPFLAIRTGTAVVILRSAESRSGNLHLFPSPLTGEMYHPDSVVNIHKKIPKDAGLEHLKFHELRHSFATTALQSGVDVKTVSAMLGTVWVRQLTRILTHSKYCKNAAKIPKII